MPRIGLSFAAVKDAAERLEAQGLPPTVMRVRAEVGGTGSLSTIARHLKEWRGATGNPLSVTGVLVAPPYADDASASTEGGVPAEVGQIARSAWQRLADLAAEQVSEVQARCEADKEDTSRRAAEQIAQAQQQAVEQQTAAHQQVAQARAAAERAEQQARLERDERMQAAQQANQQREADVAERASLEQQLQVTATHCEELTKQLAKSEIGRHKAEEARDMAIERQRSSEAQSQARMDKAAHVEQQRMASLTTSFERLMSAAKQEQTTLQDQLRTRASTLSARDAEIESHKHQVGRLEAQLEHVMARLRRAEAQLDHSEQARATERSQLDEMQRALSRREANDKALSALQQQLAAVDARLSYLPVKH